MAERTAYFLIGVVAAVIANLILEAVRVWKDVEARRAKLKLLASLLGQEVERRLFFLRNRTDDEGEMNWRNAVYSDGPCDEPDHVSYYERGLVQLSSVYRAYQSSLIEFDRKVALSLLEHYDGATEKLKADGGAFRALPVLRAEAEALVSLLQHQEDLLNKRSFITWVRQAVVRRE